jgi:hypothetical protein
MRKFLITAVAAAAVGAIAAGPAMAQLPKTSVTVDAKVTPKNAGTKKKPQGVKLSGTVNWKTEEGFEPPVITGATVFIGKGGRYNGGKYTKCSLRAIRRDGGPEENCPKKSIMGKATVTAWADTVQTFPKVVFVNGGAKSLFFYTRIFHPALVQEPIVSKIKKVSGQWAYRTDLEVPRNLRVVAGVPIAVTQFKFSVGGKPYAKNYFETTSCPKGGYKFQVETRYEYVDGTTSSSQYGDRVPCTK